MVRSGSGSGLAHIGSGSRLAHLVAAHHLGRCLVKRGHRCAMPCQHEHNQPCVQWCAPQRDEPPTSSLNFGSGFLLGLAVVWGRPLLSCWCRVSLSLPFGLGLWPCFPLGVSPVLRFSVRLLPCSGLWFSVRALVVSGGWWSCWLSSRLHWGSRSGPGGPHCVRSPSFLRVSCCHLT